MSAESSGISAWTKTAKVSVILPDGSPKRYFLKVQYTCSSTNDEVFPIQRIDNTQCATLQGARALAEGEFYSIRDIDTLMPGLVPKEVGWGEYFNGEQQVYFYLGDFRDLDFSTPPDPAHFIDRVVELHQKGTSPNGMFGYHVPTVCGIMERTVNWEKNWVKAFTRQLEDVIKYDNETNGQWPQLDAALKQLIDAVIPRLLGALQANGREITPTLIHGDLWEQNIAHDMETGEMIWFDAGCIYAHNEMEFGGWRCTWASNLRSPIYMRLYQRYIEPSEPAEEWDDRNRLYAIRCHINESAGHPGSDTRQMQAPLYF